MFLFWCMFWDERGTTLAITRKVASTSATATAMNANFAEIEAVINGNIDGDNIKDDGVSKGKLASDVVRAGYGLSQHTDGSLQVDVSDTTPGLEITDGGVRAKVYGLASRTSNGIDIGRSGDLLLSSSSTTPDGWTDVSSTYANKMIRISATALSTGGSDTLSGSTGSTTLTAAQSGVPAHTHLLPYGGADDGSGVGGYIEPPYNTTTLGGTSAQSGIANSATAASEGHTHTLTSTSCVPAYVTSKMYQKT